MTLLIGVAAIVVMPNLRGTTAEASTAHTALASARLSPAPLPPAPKKKALAEVDEFAVPADSGSGRRIVFDQSDQRVWLVGNDNAVAETYLVSGSIHDNLNPGTYRVQARYRNATAFDYSGTMEYFVQFTRGKSEPIGFHSVPKDNSGVLEQTKDELGTPLSAGCIRQWLDDAITLWEFAPIGTTVVVTA